MARDQVFISYSHVDSEWLERLQTMLAPLQRQGTLDVWADTRIQPGQLWKEEIQKALARAKVAVLLVSPDFLASEFIDKDELSPLLEASRTEGLTILWVPIRHSLYKATTIARFQAACDPKTPLSTLPLAQQEAELVRIAEKLIAIQPMPLTPSTLAPTIPKKSLVSNWVKPVLEELLSLALSLGYKFASAKDTDTQGQSFPVTRYDHAKLSDLASELAQGHRVMIGSDSKEWWTQNPLREYLFNRLDRQDSDHAVLSVGIDTTDSHNVCVVVYDPYSGDPINYYQINYFLEAWRDGDFPMVATQVPFPVSEPSMFNFDYDSGHLPYISGMSHDEFPQVRDQPERWGELLEISTDIMPSDNEPHISERFHDEFPQVRDQPERWSELSETSIHIMPSDNEPLGELVPVQDQDFEVKDDLFILPDLPEDSDTLNR